MLICSSESMEILAVLYTSRIACSQKPMLFFVRANCDGGVILFASHIFKSLFPCWYLIFSPNLPVKTVCFLLSHTTLVLGQSFNHVQQFLLQLSVLLHHPELRSPWFTFCLSVIVSYRLQCEDVYLEEVLWAFPRIFSCFALNEVCVLI